MTRLSDLDLFCWNPRRTPLPDLTGRHARALDLVTCDGDSVGLRGWAEANATDLHAVLFGTPLGPPTGSSAQFAAVVAALWRDDALRAREVYHLVATSISFARLFGATLYRPEKFAVGATRCWSALAQCGQLFAGVPRGDGTAANLRRLASDGLVNPMAATSFREAMRLRRLCEDGDATFAELADAYDALKVHYLTCVGELVRAIQPWLARHAPLTRTTFSRFRAELLDAPHWAPPAESPDPTGEVEAMMQTFLAPDTAIVRELLGQHRHGLSWWVRHAALMNVHCDPSTLRSIVDAVVRAGSWWADRNLILYAIRHPAADRQLLDHIRGMSDQLRPMDRAALAAREQTRHVQRMEPRR
jgi:hypothetical protein